MKKIIKILLTGTLTATTILAMSITSKAATVKVTGDVLNIRKGPSTDTDVVAMISKDTECELIKEDGNWYKVKYKNYTGYVSKDYVKVIDDIPNNEEEEKETKKEEQQDTNAKEPINNDEQNAMEPIYKKFKKDSKIKILPLIYSNNIGNAKKNEQVYLISETSGWSYIATDTICGWVRSELLEDSKAVQNEKKTKQIEESNESNKKAYTEKTGYINEDLVNVRKGAGTSYNVIKTLSLNSQVTIIGEEENWYKIKSGNDEGYVSKEFISDSKKVTTRGNTTSRKDVSNSVSEKDSKTTSNEKVANNSTKTAQKSTTETTTKQSKVEAKETSTSIKGTDVIAYAQKYLGHKYVYGGDGSNGTFDCSGFTMYVFKHFGISLPHGATSQYNSGKGKKISKQSDLKTGDIVFLTDYSTGVGIGHCGIYIGNGNFIHASTTTYSVIISSLNTTYSGRFYAGLRLI